MESTTTVGGLISGSVATTVANTIGSFSLPIDITVVLVLFLALFGIGFLLKKGHFIGFIASLYFAILLYLRVPNLDRLLISTGTPLFSFLSHLLVFFLFVVVGFVLMRQIVAVNPSYRSLFRFLEIALLAATTAGLLIALSYHVIPLASLYDFAPMIDRFFVESNYFFWWLLAPLFAIIITTRR